MCEKNMSKSVPPTDPLLHIICSLHYIRLHYISCVSEQVKGILTGGQKNMYQIYFISTQKRAHAQPAEKNYISAQTNSRNMGRDFDQLWLSSDPNTTPYVRRQNSLLHQTGFTINIFKCTFISILIYSSLKK